ncbi:ABC transporter permease [uncultured Corynebacterium sp.]|uniref:ABC transporter permease n=1 Tax=uncultured Corynebacterium sp. TaxID=159447 RepID=UPI0025934149|nr:ABC transporter permease [uncultured Corynebacterium sp.]
MFKAEISKLRRSSTWLIVCVIPILAVVAGTVNYSANQEMLGVGWQPFLGQITLFYSLFFYSIGTSILTAAVWRTEHHGTNWNLVLTSVPHLKGFVAAKFTAVAMLTLAMQLALALCAFGSGISVGHLPVEPVALVHFAVASTVGYLVGFSIIAAQTLLSAWFDSFAAPVAINIAMCFVGLGAVSERAGAMTYLIPQALFIRANTMGSTAIANSAQASVAAIAPLVAAAALITATAPPLTVRVIRHRRVS